MTKDPYYRPCALCPNPSKVIGENGVHLCETCATVALAFTTPNAVQKVLR